eukprot:SAG25_NODE_343_length_9443_cov_3.590218_9_plen_106_part_00
MTHTRAHAVSPTQSREPYHLPLDLFKVVHALCTRCARSPARFVHARASCTLASLNTDRVATGAVCCGGKVMLQKSAPHNKIEMHGALCGDYYKVRDILYSQFDMF